jgi:NADH:ubiquinone oxidoreductase subunit 6 (subunit J)
VRIVTITVLFVALALLAVAGACGLLFARHTAHAAAAFLACAAALAGLYGLLDLRFAAAVQAALGVGLSGALLVTSLPRGEQSSPVRRVVRYGAAAVPLLVIILLAMARGRVSESALSLPPVWASRGSYLFALGQQMASSFLAPVLLICLLLAVSVLSIRVLLRSEAKPPPDRGEQ